MVTDSDLEDLRDDLMAEIRKLRDTVELLRTVVDDAMCPYQHKDYLDTLEDYIDLAQSRPEQSALYAELLQHRNRFLKLRGVAPCQGCHAPSCPTCNGMDPE